MNYLPDETLPRPGDLVVTSGIGMPFPKGIPIGTVVESTRGMDANKQYIVVNPTADFQHLERVIVLLYQPEPEKVQGREENNKEYSFGNPRARIAVSAPLRIAQPDRPYV